MTFPAWPWSRISRVDDTFKASRNKVASNSSEGKMENSKGSVTFMVSRRTNKAAQMLVASNISQKEGPQQV